MSRKSKKVFGLESRGLLIINHARSKQRSLIVTLIYLKNAFGEVHHRLIRTVLLAHHMPEENIWLIENLYTDFSVSIITKGFITKPISVERGVLQGDCLSPLLFNLCVNSLIRTTNDEKLKCLGYVNNATMNPRHWFQFADDTAIISAHEQDNQLLCNVFNKWCIHGQIYIYELRNVILSGSRSKLLKQFNTSQL